MAREMRPTQTTDAPAVYIGDTAGMAAGITQTWATDGGEPGWEDTVLAGLAPPERALAAISFISGGPAVAHRLDAAVCADLGPDPGSASPTTTEPRRQQVIPVIDEDRYLRMVREAVRRVGAGDLAKVVLGRVVDVLSDPPLRAGDVVRRMLAERPGRYVFSMPLRAGPDSPVILGASPELLVRRQGAQVTSLPLAGSIPRSDDPDEDRARAESLLASTKDQAEHAFVVAGITELLAPYCSHYEAAPTPTLVGTDTMWHLASPIRGQLEPVAQAPSALHLARLLQPTAAVGGTPTHLAQDTINELEGNLRGFLAGAVGWVDGTGDGEFALAIRSGVLHGNTLRLFAGAGIVADSEPATELREVDAKLGTMMRMVGL